MSAIAQVAKAQKEDKPAKSKRQANPKSIDEFL
jgi:hypothetical protein